MRSTLLAVLLLIVGPSMAHARCALGGGYAWALSECLLAKHNDGAISGNIASNAALKLIQGSPGMRVMRAGFASPSDGGGAVYNWSQTNCAAADDGAQVQPTGKIGCWIADFSGVNPTPMIWGCRGDGTTNDTGCVQAAIDVLAGRTLYLGPHRYCIGASGLTTYKPIRIQDESKNNRSEPIQYGFVACSKNIHMLTFSNNGTTGADGSHISDVYFNARAAGKNTTGAAVVFYAVSNLVAENLRIDGACIGIDDLLANTLTVRSTQIVNDVSGNSSLLAGCGGMRVGHLSTHSQDTDTKIIDTTISVRADYSLLVEDAGGLQIRGADFLFAVNGTVIRPGFNQYVIWMFSNDSTISDTTCSSGLVIDTADSSAVVAGLDFNQTWTSSAGKDQDGGCVGSGVQIGNSKGGIVRGVHFVGHRAYANGNNGVLVLSGVDDITFDSSEICGNSTIALQHPEIRWNGVSLDVGAKGVALRNNRISDSCASTTSVSRGTQLTGIFFWGANSDMTIIGNDLRGNSTQGIGSVTGMTLTGKNVIANNNGIDTETPSVADAASITVSLNPVTAITGSGTTITTVNNMWDGREAQLYMRDGSITFATGGNLCNGGTFAQKSSATLLRIPGAGCSTVK